MLSLPSSPDLSRTLPDDAGTRGVDSSRLARLSRWRTKSPPPVREPRLLLSEEETLWVGAGAAAGAPACEDDPRTAAATVAATADIAAELRMRSVPRSSRSRPAGTDWLCGFRCGLRLFLEEDQDAAGALLDPPEGDGAYGVLLPLPLLSSE